MLSPVLCAVRHRWEDAAMSREITSTARPSGLRLAGFLCLAAGAVVAGVASTMRWAVIGFPGDASGANDVPVHGTDIWEGKVVLLSVIVVLVATLAMRLTASDAARRGLALLLVALGIVCAVLPALTALRAEDRLGGAQGLDRVARSLAAELGLPEDVVRGQLDRPVRAPAARGRGRGAVGDLGRRTRAGRGRRAQPPVDPASPGGGGRAGITRRPGRLPRARPGPRTWRGCPRRPRGAPSARRR